VATIEDGAEAIARRLKQRTIDPAFRAEKFCFNAEANTCICPAGKVLRHQGARLDRVGIKRHVYRARAADCRDCPLRKQCCLGTSARTIVCKEIAPAIAAYLAKMQTEAAKQIYQLRGAVAEFPNAWLKSKIGLRQFRLRGLKKVRCEALWACITYNIQQWCRLRWKVRLIAADE
jgi:Transposase DDE domain